MESEHSERERERESERERERETDKKDSECLDTTRERVSRMTHAM